MKAADEVRSDFEAAVSQIDFGKYDPFSSAFDSALRVGLMCFLLERMGAGQIVEKEAQDDISAFISDGKHLLQKSIDTGDGDYKEMALKELDMAEMLIKKAMARLPSGEERSKLKSYEATIAEVREQA